MKHTIAWIVLVAVIACGKSSPTDETITMRGAVTDANALLGRWRLVELDGQPAISGAGVRVPYLIFTRDSVDHVAGESGCNHLSGRFATDGAHITFSHLISTRAACGEDAGNRQEARFFAALRTADRYTISGETLALKVVDAVVARFVKS